MGNAKTEEPSPRPRPSAARSNRPPAALGSWSKAIKAKTHIQVPVSSTNPRRLERLPIQPAKTIPIPIPNDIVRDIHCVRSAPQTRNPEISPYWAKPNTKPPPQAYIKQALMTLPTPARSHCTAAAKFPWLWGSGDGKPRPRAITGTTTITARKRAWKTTNWRQTVQGNTSGIRAAKTAPQPSKLSVRPIAKANLLAGKARRASKAEAGKATAQATPVPIRLSISPTRSVLKAKVKLNPEAIKAAIQIQRSTRPWSSSRPTGICSKP